MIEVFAVFGWLAASLATACFLSEENRNRPITIGSAVKSLVLIVFAPAIGGMMLLGWIIVALASLDIWETVIYDPNKDDT